MLQTSIGLSGSGPDVPSVQSVEQQEDGADADHRAQDEGVPPFTQVDPLDEIVDGGEPVSQGQALGNIFDLWLNRHANRTCFLCSQPTEPPTTSR